MVQKQNCGKLSKANSSHELYTKKPFITNGFYVVPVISLEAKQGYRPTSTFLV